MKNIRLAAISLIVVFMAGSVVYAQTEHENWPGRDKLRESILKELNLTPEQEKNLEENRKTQSEEMVKLRTAMKEKQAKLQEALKDPAVTKATVEPLVNDMKSLVAQLVDNRIDGIFEVKQILTPEQLVKFQQMMEKQKEGRKERFQNWREKRKGIDQHQEE